MEAAPHGHRLYRGRHIDPARVGLIQNKQFSVSLKGLVAEGGRQALLIFG